jgi:hypothetical protein
MAIKVDAGCLPDIGSLGCRTSIEITVPSLIGCGSLEHQLTIPVIYPEIFKGGDANGHWFEDIILSIAIGGKSIGDIDIRS